jgi:hypothetical protein
MVFHIVSSDLTAVKLVPSTANASEQLANIENMAKEVPGAVVGVNGGYFWEVHQQGFWFDDVCFDKLRGDALQNVSMTNPNLGIGDTLLIKDGKVLSSACDSFGYNLPVSLVLNGTSSYFVVQDAAARLPSDVKNAIGCGPNLVSWDASSQKGVYGVPFFDESLNRFGSLTCVCLFTGVQMGSFRQCCDRSVGHAGELSHTLDGGR